MNIEDIQNTCKMLPLVTEDIKWKNNLVFSIGGKIFCIMDINHFPITASFKVSEEMFDEMRDREGFKPAPYVGKYKWVMIEDVTKTNETDWKKYIEQSYNLVKAKLSHTIKTQFGIE